MPTTAINDTFPSLLDAANHADPKGGIARLVEVLQRNSPAMADAPVKEGNLPTGHRTTMRTALPSGTWRRLNEGIPATKALAGHVDETCGQLAFRSVVDPDVAALYGNQAAFRAAQDAGAMQAMAHEIETGLFYHSTATHPERFNGLTPRLTSTSGTWGGQIINSQISSSGNDQASAWFVCWGEGGAYLIYPKGSRAGITVEDMGKQEVADANGNMFPAWVSIIKQHIGLVVEDARQVVRVANIDTSAIAETGLLLIQDLIKGFHQLRNPRMGKCVLYVNRKVATYLHLQSIIGAVNSTLSFEKDVKTGQPVTMFMGVPVHTTDALTNTESVVS